MHYQREHQYYSMCIPNINLITSINRITSIIRIISVITMYAGDTGMYQYYEYCYYCYCGACRGNWDYAGWMPVCLCFMEGLNGDIVVKHGFA